MSWYVQVYWWVVTRVVEWVFGHGAITEGDTASGVVDRGLLLICRGWTVAGCNATACLLCCCILDLRDESNCCAALSRFKTFGGSSFFPLSWNLGYWQVFGCPVTADLRFDGLDRHNCAGPPIKCESFHTNFNSPHRESPLISDRIVGRVELLVRRD